MKRILTLLLLFYFSHPSFSQEFAGKLDTLMSAYSRQQKFNGAVLVAKNGKVLLHKAYGLRSAATTTPHTTESVFQIGSVTKQFTTAIIQKLQEQKKLNVQDKVSKYFPNFPKGDSITIEHLMTHTSGIYSYTNDRSFMATEVSEPHSRESMMDLFKDKPLEFSPGTGWQYSNSAYSLLGYIIEEVTRKPYEKVVREYIFQPLGMTHSGFDFTHLSRPERSTGYFVLNDADTVIAPVVDSTVAYSAGSIFSTTSDLYHWHNGLQDHTILSEAQQEKAYTPVKNKYGYGWIIDTLHGKRMVFHGGGIHGFTSNFARIPEDDVCVILLSNASSPVLHEITTKIIAAVYDQPYKLPSERVAISLPEEKLKEYMGEYEIRPNLHLVIKLKEGHLIAEPTGQPAAPLFAEKEDYFFVKFPDVQLEFYRNEKNEVTGFTLYQGGATVSCKKLH